MGEAGETDEGVEPLRLGVTEHLSGELGVKLRHSHGPSGAQNGVVLVAQGGGVGKDGHGVLVVQGDLLGVDAGQVLHHADHGGVVVAQHVQLEKVVLHLVIVEVGGDDVGVRVVGRMLDGTEIVDLPVLGDDHHAAGVLAGGPADPGAAQGQTVFLRLGHL